MSPVWLEQAFQATVVWAKEVAQVGKGILKIVFWVFLAGFSLAIAIMLYESYESHQPVDHDTPVWIQGDWLVGEYRVCKMRTKMQPAYPDTLAKLPRLFCGKDANGVADFQRETYPDLQNAMLPSSDVFVASVTADEFDSLFHVLPVRYFGSTQPSPEKDFIYDYDRTDKWVISWRCQRNSNSLTCKSLD